MTNQNPVHVQAAEIARRHLPDYLGDWVAGVLLETHSLPPLIEHQDRLAEATMKSLELAQGLFPDPRTATLDPGQHLRRARELVRIGEQKLLEDPTGHQSVGPAQLAQAHVAIAAADRAEVARQEVQGPMEMVNQLTQSMLAQAMPSTRPQLSTVSQLPREVDDKQE